MHKLDRRLVDTPACLAAYDYKTQTWDDIGSQCKAEVRSALAAIQGTPEYGVRCAYCEGTVRHAGHIEHFRRKEAGHFPHLCFTWNNLFLACGSRAHCGHFKDRRSAPAYDPDLLIKPDDDNPDDFLRFHSSGEVRIQQGLIGRDAERATETIRVFGLNDAALVAARARAVASFKNRRILADLLELLSMCDEAERKMYLKEEIEATRHDEYATTIKHFLQRTT